MEVNSLEFILVAHLDTFASRHLPEVSNYLLQNGCHAFLTLELLGACSCA